MYNSQTYSVQFFFRLWLYPNDCEPLDIETWVHELDTPWSRNGTSVRNWVSDSVSCVFGHGIRKKLGLDGDAIGKHWQVIGKAEIQGRVSHSLDGSEYEEELELLEFEKCEVPASYFDDEKFSLDGGDA